MIRRQRAQPCRRAIAILSAAMGAALAGCSSGTDEADLFRVTRLAEGQSVTAPEGSTRPPTRSAILVDRYYPTGFFQPLSIDAFASQKIAGTPPFQTPSPQQPITQPDPWEPLMLSDNPPESAGEPVVVHSRPAMSWFNAEIPTGSLDFKYYFEQDRTKQGGGTSTASTNTFQETISVVDQAYILSPNLLDLKLGGTFGLQQDSFTADGERRYSPGILDGWDVTGVILRNETAPLSLYSHRTEQIVTPDFSPSLQSTDTTYGANLLIRSESLPTSLDFHHSDDSQVELAGGTANFKMSQDLFHWHTDAIALPHQTLSWDYNYNNISEQESGGGPVNYQTHDANLNHTYTFGPADVSSLASSLSATEQTGTLAYDRLHLDENLLLQHTDDFQTHYEYTLEQVTTGGITQTSNALDVGLSHHLFKSLVTTADVGGALIDSSDNNNIEQLFGRTDFSYRKLIPYGTLLGDLNLGWQWQQTSEGTGPIPVINQPYTFSNSQPLVLTQPNIDPKSIQVLSSAGMPYVKGRDFVVNSVGNLIQIQRVVSGLIPPDGGILLDYNLLPEPENTTTTANGGISARYDIDKGLLTGLSPYVRYSKQEQTIDAGAMTSTLVPNSFDDIVIGADWRIWQITCNAEQQWHEATLVPFDATRFSIRFNQKLDLWTTASLAASYTALDYYGENDNATDEAFTAALERKFSKEFTVRVRAIWLDDRDQLFGNTKGLEEQIEAEWTHRQTHVYARVRNATLSTGAQDSTFQVFDFGISRRF